MWKKLRKEDRPFIILFLLWFIPIFLTLASGICSSLRDAVKPKESIISISSTAFFNDLPGVFYIYFGRPSCPDCTEFGPVLEETLKTNSWQVYYFDTLYWKDDAQYERIITKYHVDDVPLLVKTVDGDFAGAYHYRPDDREQAEQNLKAFFISRGDGVLSVTEDNRPVQFHDRLMSVTFLAILTNTAWLLAKCLSFRSGKGAGFLVFPALLNNSAMILLHFLIAGLGFSFALQYNASPGDTLMDAIGRATWLTGTPVLYGVNMLLCAWMAVNRRPRKPLQK